MKENPIIMIDDDEDDIILLREALRNVGVKHEIICFQSPNQAFKYLQTTDARPILIICDINMPLMSGPALKKMLNEQCFIHKEKIPFVFLSTAGNDLSPETLSKLDVQGYFQKVNNIAAIDDLAKSIFHLVSKD
jgi:CheY-like chemotaxis protein